MVRDFLSILYVFFCFKVFFGEVCWNLLMNIEFNYDGVNFYVEVIMFYVCFESCY